MPDSEFLVLVPSQRPVHFGIQVARVFALSRSNSKFMSCTVYGFNCLKGWSCGAEIRHAICDAALQGLAGMLHDVLNADSAYKIAASFWKTA